MDLDVQHMLNSGFEILNISHRFVCTGKGIVLDRSV